ncbi:TIGR03747 family integrating conjugative element membrane protein [Erwinia psidii]|uniref:TIGR03747 family integrating conjugative element membrane protein n=1 Tax=Erwinia psidii TaxID=69224 RepID=UPI00226B438D|nr:TIGR03747 family integrating conjugative element membrane protein [Erwinia psidii]MCX8967303.1 TIGR03747 family integrating conjugative element membrane protein [Erwinia psidii]
MSDTPPEKNAAPQKGVIATPLSWVGKVIVTLIGSLFFSLMVEWVGMAFFWPELGAEHSHRMMNEELGWFADNVTYSLLVADPAAHLDLILHQTWQWLFIDTGFMSWVERLRHQPEGHWIHWIDIYIQATVYITLTFVLRVFILLLTAPLFILSALLGIIDGLVRRDIRRYGCGYESGFIYHHAKRTVLPVFFLTWMIYLSLPFSVNPCLILLPAAGIFGCVITVSVGTFKKYI